MCIGKIEEQKTPDRGIQRERRHPVTEIFCVHGSGIRCFCWELRNQDEKPLVSQLDASSVRWHLWVV